VTGPGSPSSGAAPKRAVIFEFHQIGNAVKVAAVDEATGVEVSIVGPSSAMRSDLEKVARAKLMRALEKLATQTK
jgi:hypothetical protein